MTEHRYPLEPLLDLIGGSHDAACKMLGVSGSTQKRYRAEGVTEKVADRLASRAGYHPSEVWPEMVDHLIEAERRRTNAIKAASHRRRYHTDPEWAAKKRAEAQAWRALNRDRDLAERRRRYHEEGGNEAQRRRRANESPEQRERRLAAQRRYDRARRA